MKHKSEQVRTGIASLFFLPAEAAICPLRTQEEQDFTLLLL